MKHFFFGYDREHPAACARDLKARGIDAVVGGGFSQEAARAFREAGIDFYLCYGAHSLKAGESRGRLALNFQGEEKRWFGSGCPNDTSSNREKIQRVLEEAEKITGLKGIFVDGARFASFASAEGPDAFFTCFCPACMEKMQELGMDGEKIRAAVDRLHQEKSFPEEEITYLAQWFSFREMCVKEYMEAFSKSVHERNPRWQAGAFIFAPSLGYFVGQTPAACASLDLLSPMLYRSYPHAHGPACLNHEWAGFYGLLGRNASILRGLSPVHLHGEKEREAVQCILEQGFEPDAVALETRAAVKYASARQFIAPIIQSEDDCLEETAQKTLAAGAQGVGYFAYGRGMLPPLLKK